MFLSQRSINISVELCRNKCLLKSLKHISFCLFRFQRASNRQTNGRRSQAKNKHIHDECDSQNNHIELGVDNKMISRNGNRSSNAIANGDWKLTLMQRKRLENSTNAAAQQQSKTKASGPTSPTEAAIAPIYYNGNTDNTRNGKISLCLKNKCQIHFLASQLFTHFPFCSQKV